MPMTLSQYAEYLDSRDLSWPAPPDVDVPKAKPYVTALPDLRAVTWSVYGTLLNIVGGELYFEHPQKFIMDLALDKTLQEFKMWRSMTRKPGQPAAYLGQLYAKEMEQLRAVPSPGEKYPEINVAHIWEGIVKKLFQKEYAYDVGFYGPTNEYSEKIAYFFHASLQGTGCHNGAFAALQQIKAAGLRQGVLDNGQIFSLLQLERGLQAQESGVKLPALFDVDLCQLSYLARARKPSPALFGRVLDMLLERGIAASDVLHIGSSIDRDVVPAKRLGMKTALFAGDKQSLQATKEQWRDAACRPDLILTDLAQISQVVATS